jgi:predicted CXXCH cytochrome family protein
MIVKNQGTLCLDCHAAMGKQIKSSADVHNPVETGTCTKCHSPHQTKLAKLLLTQSPDICLACHKDLKERLEKDNKHQPAAGDCLTCHLPHLSSQRRLLTDAVPSLCVQCHAATASSFRKAHINIDAAVMDCTSCHDPHASKDPKLFKKIVHAPFAGRSCDECHIVKTQ